MKNKEAADFKPELQNKLEGAVEEIYVGKNKFIKPEFFDKTKEYNQSLHPYKPENAESSDGEVEETVLTLNKLSLQTKSREEEISKVLETGNLVILMNHDVTVNLRILEYLINKVVGVAREDLYKVVGSIFVMHSGYYESGTGGGNLIHVLTKKIAKKAPELMRAMRDAFIEVQKEISGKVGKVIFIAPSGTTDYFDEKTGEILMIKPDKGVLGMIKGFLGENGKVMYAGTVAREVFQKGIPQKGNVYMELGEIKEAPKSVDEITENIVPLIKNGDKKCSGGVKEA